MGTIRNDYKVLVKRPERQRPLEIPRRRCKNAIKIGFK
jgi:hypothetical protein